MPAPMPAPGPERQDTFNSWRIYQVN